MARIVYAPGVWDMLHVGHLHFLTEAAKHGDLFVGVPADRVVLEDKGAYPVIPELQRREMVAALKVVEGAVIYQTLDFIPQLELLQPHVLAVGEEWGEAKRHKDAEEWMRSHGGTVVRIPRFTGVSSSIIKQRVKQS